MLPIGAAAQYVEPQPGDYYKRSYMWEKKPQELYTVRETDVYWSRLVWRIIDVREKENQYFYFPQNPEGIRGRKNLAYVLWDAINAGEIELFEDDEMKKVIEPVVERWKEENEIDRKEELKLKHQKTMQEIEERRQEAERKKHRAALRNAEHKFIQNNPTREKDKQDG